MRRPDDEFLAGFTVCLLALIVLMLLLTHAGGR